MAYGPYNHQGYFGECFVRVLAGAAGLIAGQQDIDVTGVDFSFDLPGNRGTTRYPKIEAQVKSWTNPRGDADAWHYPMRARNFNDLAGSGFQVSRYLFLVLVPADQTLFAEVDTEMLRLRHCGYWVSLADRQPLDFESQQTTTVYVPRRNVLTVSALRELLRPVPVQRAATS
jgi:hypothetical protein